MFAALFVRPIVVDHGVVGNTIEPGAEGGVGRLIVAQPLPCLHKDCLRQIFGVTPAIHPFVDILINRVEMALIKLAIGILTATLCTSNDIDFCHKFCFHFVARPLIMLNDSEFFLFVFSLVLWHKD